jgi:hypothetical protein
MPCDTRLKPRQTLSQRAEEVRRVVATLDSYLARGLASVKVGPEGAIAFVDFPESERDGVTDACIYRRLMATGSALAKAKIARAEQLSGRTVSRQAIAQGVHSHDGGKTWHHGH